MSNQGATSMRVEPRPIVGLGIFVMYLVIFAIGFMASGVDYDEVADTTNNILKAIVVPVGIGALALLVVTYLLGWWRSVFRDENRAPRWTLLIPAFFAAAILGGLATADWADKDASLVLWLLVGTFFVGIAEETLTRGLLLVGFRGGMGEVGVWFWTSVLFGAIHALNIVFGQSVGATMQQMVFAFLFGSVLYACRRATGLLVVPIVLHGLWDFTTFLASGSDATTSTAAGLQGIIVYGALIVTIVALIKRSLFHVEEEPTGAAEVTEPS